MQEKPEIKKPKEGKNNLQHSTLRKTSGEKIADETSTPNQNKKNPLFIVYDYDATKNEPNGKKNLEKAVIQLLKERPNLLIAHAKHFINEPYAEDIIDQATEKYPAGAIYYFKQYSDQPYASKILEKAIRLIVKTDPQIALSCINLYKSKTYAKNILLEGIKKFPFAALDRFAEFEGETYANEILEKSIRILVEKEVKVDREKGIIIFTKVPMAPGVAISRYFDLYKNKGYAKEILMMIAEHDPKSVLNHFHKYENENYAKEVIMNTITRDPNIVLAWLKTHENPYKDELLMKISEKQN